MFSNDSTSVPVLFLGHPSFYWVHISAATSCSISVMFSASVLVSFLCSARKSSRSFWRMTIGERLVFYLVVCDIGFSISHGTDHTMMMITGRHAPEPICTIFSFLLHEFCVAQSLVVNLAAVVAVVMLVRERKVEFGKFDWCLISYAFGIPLIIGVLATVLGYFGPSGAW